MTGHEATIRRLYDEVWTRADFRGLGELLAPQFTFHFRGQAHAQTPEHLKQVVQRWKAALPDIVFQVADVVVEGHRAAAQIVYRGTHRGEWKGIPPTGRRVEVHEMVFFRFEGDRVGEVWEVTDEFALRRQLGEL